MSRLIVYAGPNGAGKSSLRTLSGEAVDVIIDPDQIARSLISTNAEQLEIQAGRESIKLFHKSLAEGKSISLESTLTGQTVLNRMTDARKAGYQVELRFVALASAEIHVSRVAQRVQEGGHDIPSDTIIRRYERSLDNLPKALGIAHKGFVFDNSEYVQQLLRTESGVIVFQHLELPAWLQKRMRDIQAELTA